MDIIERNIYSIICRKNGIKAKDIAVKLGLERKTINQYLYGSPYMKELCYQDHNFAWHGIIRQMIPHLGLEKFCGYYGMVEEFLDTDYEFFFESLKDGCKKIGRNLNDTRGLFHSFEDSYNTMQNLFFQIKEYDWSDWEIGFELRIKKSRMIRIYADVILITKDKVFSLEFKMKNVMEEKDLEQASKYAAYLEVIFGSDYDIIPALVLTGAENYYEDKELSRSTAIVPVCSGDSLGQLLKDYI